MPNLPRARLCVLPAGSDKRQSGSPRQPRRPSSPEVKNGSGIIVEPAQNATLGSADCSRQPLVTIGSHLARLGFDGNIPRLDQFRLVLSPPLHGPLEPLLAILELPLGRSHVPGVRARVRQEALFPIIVRVRVGELDRLGVLWTPVISLLALRASSACPINLSHLSQRLDLRHAISIYPQPRRFGRFSEAWTHLLELLGIILPLFGRLDTVQRRRVNIARLGQFFLVGFYRLERCL